MEEVVVDNPSTLCRVCLNSGNYQLTTEITVDNENVTLEEMLLRFSSLEKTENVPAKLCFKCISELGDSYMFMEKVKRADECIRNLFGTHSEDELQMKQDTDGKDNYDEDINTASTEAINPGDLLATTDYVETLDIPDTDALESIVEEPKMPERTSRATKKPHIVLTDKVSHILSRVRKDSVEYLIEEIADERSPLVGEPPAKRRRTTDRRSLLVTKFVLQPYNPLNSQTGTIPAITDDGNLGRDLCADPADVDAGTSSVTTKAQTVDLIVVEINASDKIIADEIASDTNIEDPNRVYMCKFCPKAFSTSHHLLMHTRKSHVCLFCTQSFVKVEDLHRHSKEDHRSFQCSLCEKQFSTNSNLRLHLKRVHEVDLPPYVTLVSSSGRWEKLGID